MKHSIFQMRHLSFAALFLGLSSHSVFAGETYHYQVLSNRVTDQPLTITFEQRPRLGQLLHTLSDSFRKKGLNPNTAFFWAGAGLFDKNNSSQIENQKQATLSELSMLQIKINKEQVSHVSALHQWIVQSQFHLRILTSLDEDKILTAAAQNPLLENSLLLNLPRRPSYIWLVGDLDQAAQLKFSTTYTTKDYLSQIDNLWLRGRDTVTLIQPNGEIQSVNIAYWNENHTRLIPGTTIYVPFLNLSSEFEQLNTEIPRLLQHRILTS